MELAVDKNRHFFDKNEFFDRLVIFNRGRGIGQRVPNDHLEPMVLVKFTRATPDGGRLNDLETSRKEQRHPEKLTTKKKLRMVFFCRLSTHLRFFLLPGVQDFGLHLQVLLTNCSKGLSSSNRLVIFKGIIMYVPYGMV